MSRELTSQRARGSAAERASKEPENVEPTARLAPVSGPNGKAKRRRAGLSVKRRWQGWMVLCLTGWVLALLPMETVGRIGKESANGPGGGQGGPSDPHLRTVDQQSRPPHAIKLVEPI